MHQIIGTNNKGLEINLTDRTVQRFEITYEDRRKYLGGKGLGLKYLYERMRPGVDPLSGENILAIMMGALMGSGGPNSGRFAAVTKSPLTGIIASSSCGGPFGMAFKSAGYDCLLITGKADMPVYLQIDALNVEIKEAKCLWGLDTEKTQEAFGLHRQDGALVIGPAGEHLVLYANIASGHRFLGRGGLGAVMGSKNLKAVVARGGTFKIAPHNPEGFQKIKKKANKDILNNFFTAQQYRNFGTNTNVRYCNQARILPVRNYTRGSDSRAENISGQSFRERYDIKPQACNPCTILCGHKGFFKDGIYQVPEYETVGLFGANLEIFDPEKITVWNGLCGRLGMDTISCASSIAFWMEAGEKGLIQTDLKFGLADGVSELLEDIAFRRDAGDEIANGSRWLSQKFGGEEYAMQVKGLEMAAYDPRGSWGQGLAYAVANRGGCHLSATLFPLEIFFGFLDPHSIRAKPEFVKFFEDLYAAINSLHSCLFTAFAYVLEAPIVKLVPKPLLAFTMQYMPQIATRLMDFGVYTRLLETAVGIKLTQREFLQVGERVHVLERYMNTREGITRLDDQLPARFLHEVRTDDPKGLVVPLEVMLDKYYKLRGFDGNGIPTAETLEELEIQIKY